MKLEFQNIRNNIFMFLKESETLRGLPFWISAIVVGLVAVLYQRFFHWGERLFLKAFAVYPESVFLIVPGCFLLSWYLVYKFSQNASGSGIPQTLAAIELAQEETSERKILRSFLSFKITVVKILSSFFTALGGGIVGREGPTIQISAYIFHSIGDKFKNLWTYKNLDIWFVTGGAAGIAAAFNTPLGGIVYAIEELSRSHINRFKTSLITGVIIAGFVAQVLAGGYIFIGVPKISPFSYKVLPFALLIGVLAGMLGALFGKILSFCVQKRKQIHNFKLLFFMSLGFGLLLATMIYFGGVLVPGSGKRLIADVLFNGQPSSLWIFLSKYVGAIISYANGGAGGVFAPSLSLGASLGSFISELLHMENKNLFAIFGMVAFLTGVTRAPFTAFVLVLEMTDRHSVILPTMIAALAAQISARSIGPHSFYEEVKSIYLLSFKLNKKEIQEVRI